MWGDGTPRSDIATMSDAAPSQKHVSVEEVDSVQGDPCEKQNVTLPAYSQGRRRRFGRSHETGVLGIILSPRVMMMMIMKEKKKIF